MSSAQKIVVEPSALAQRTADWLAETLQRTLAGGGRCSFALSGGKTVGPIYRILAGMKLPWERVDFYFADERCVPPDHLDSNYFLAEETFFRPAGIPLEQVRRMEGEREDRDAAARDYAALLPPALDVVLLGMGEDGHTASLFPGLAAVEEQERKVLAVVGPKPPPWRLTLTLPVLNAARHVLFAVSGEGKRDALRRVSAGEDLPSGRIKNAVWIVDRPAAGQ